MMLTNSPKWRNSDQRLQALFHTFPAPEYYFVGQSHQNWVPENYLQEDVLVEVTDILQVSKYHRFLENERIWGTSNKYTHMGLWMMWEPLLFASLPSMYHHDHDHVPKLIMMIKMIKIVMTIITFPLRAAGRLSPASRIGPKKFFRVSSRSFT